MSAEDLKKNERQIAKSAARIVPWVNNSALASSNAHSITSATASSFTATLEISTPIGITTALAAASLSQFLTSAYHVQTNSMISNADAPTDDEVPEEADREIQRIYGAR